MNLERLITKCNNILRAELGFQDGGEYAWKYSEDLRRAQKIVHDDGTPVREIRATSSGLLLACDTYRIVPMFDHRVHLQWILTKRVMPDMSESQWMDEFGSSIPYPYTGQFIPCSPVYLARGETPSVELTWGVVGAFRAQRKLKIADIDAETRELLASKEASKYNEILDSIKECGTAFNGVPGTKEHYSFGGVKDVQLAPPTQGDK